MRCAYGRDVDDGSQGTNGSVPFHEEAQTSHKQRLCKEMLSQSPNSQSWITEADLILDRKEGKSQIPC